MSARAPGTAKQDEFLISPFGLAMNEISASALVKVNLKGDIIDLGSSTLPPNKAGVNLHSMIYKAKPNIQCILHGHMPEAVAVSCTELLPLSQSAIILGKVGYHDYGGIVMEASDATEESKERFLKDLGDHKILFLRNHGVISCGESVAEAIVTMKNCMDACKVQVMATAMSAGKALKIPDKKFIDQAYARHQKNLSDGFYDMEFSAFLRMVDNGQSPLLTEC